MSRTQAADRPGRVTIRDVAQHAGVSVATVSRALAGDRTVTPTTLAKVQQAVRDLDYVVNAHARGLSGRPTPMIAVIATDVRSPFVQHVAAGVQEHAAESGRFCAIFTTQGEAKQETDAVRLMREMNAEGVLLVGGVVDSADYRDRVRGYVQTLGSRLVLCGRPSPGPDIPALVVEYDNIGGAYAATSYLLSAGHRRIALITGRHGFTTTDQRVAGYRKACADFGVEVDERLIIADHTVLDRTAGYLGVQRLLREDADFSAVFTGTDTIASGALTALREAGRRVPDDVSVVGFDDLAFAQELTPPLTTVHLPHEELGRAAARMALSNVQTGSGRDHVLLGTHLVIRDSVRPYVRTAG
ncbi:LacI family DNA-binding transcriptional regulator [Dactylosporangium vinaceum]|uniref:LacI family DNA-binding transcriptional regulator n=1 Tax=Dactylosporangium vinaceum TaxID=53362 RepID=A0ABV5MRX2_9ACTN|nr:LacI family DNA-binding transcriptional regulator [Dactylosporangium vinaceum]UAC00316.1 LacI family DNA-binding transcriptional regulator [Dactylosporangium vinaceum]